MLESYHPGSPSGAGEPPPFYVSGSLSTSSGPLYCVGLLRFLKEPPYTKTPLCESWTATVPTRLDTGTAPS